jgi:amino acid transporter
MVPSCTHTTHSRTGALCPSWGNLAPLVRSRFTAGLVAVFVVLFDLGPISMMGSAAFLIVYAVVCLGHLRVRRQTGARPPIIWASLVALLVMFVLLMIYIMNNQPAAAVALIVTLAISAIAEWARASRGDSSSALVDVAPFPSACLVDPTLLSIMPYRQDRNPGYSPTR